nr:hypothetical protein [Phocaeicola dorei]
MEVINEATSLTSERAQEFAQFMAQSATEQGEMIVEYDKHSLQSEVAAGRHTPAPCSTNWIKRWRGRNDRCTLQRGEDCAAAQPRQPRHPCTSMAFPPYW